MSTTPPAAEPHDDHERLKSVKDLHRLLRIIVLLEANTDGAPRQWNAPALAAELGVAERTIYRDVKKLRRCGVPVKSVEGAGYRIEGRFFLQPVQLTPEEAVGLAAACGAMASREPSGVLRHAGQALDKILAQLPADIRQEVAAAASRLSVQTAPAVPADGHADVYESVRRAIAEGRVLACEYEKATPAVTSPDDDERTAQSFRFEPYALHFNVRAWYAIGRRDDRDGPRTLKLARFNRAVLTDERYAIPPDFDLRAYLGNAWSLIRGAEEHRVELRFAPAIAEVVAETTWHPTQDVAMHDDGSATFTATVAGLDEIVWWILSFGPSVRVVGPPALAERVRDLATACARQYGG